MVKKASQVKFTAMSPSMLQGFVSPLDSIKYKVDQHSSADLLPRKLPNKALSTKPFTLSPVVKFDDDDEDRHSAKYKQTSQLEYKRQDIDDSVDSIDERLLVSQHMSELSLAETDDREEWYTFVGIIVLLLTLFGHASSGVIANLVLAPSGFV